MWKKSLVSLIWMFAVVLTLPSCGKTRSFIGLNDNGNAPVVTPVTIPGVAASMKIVADNNIIDCTATGECNDRDITNLQVVFYDINGEEVTIPEATVDHLVSWNSDNIAVATVNAVSGVVTGVGTGTVHVYATTTDGSNLSATNLVTVTTPAPTTPIVQTPTTASPIFYGQTLASSTITPGTFTNAAGAAVGITSYGFVNPAIAPNAGSTNVQVYFVPTDTTDYLNATNTVTVTVNTAPAAQLKGAVQVSHGVFAFAFTNFTGLSFSVLATNNLAVPKSSWPVVGTAIEYPAGSGNYQYTNTSATGTNQFYIIRQP